MTLIWEIFLSMANKFRENKNIFSSPV